MHQYQSPGLVGSWPDTLLSNKTLNLQSSKFVVGFSGVPDPIGALYHCLNPSKIDGYPRM